MKFYIVDCFAEEKYQGNPLLVVKADRPIREEEQQHIAGEINFSETAFILSNKQENGGYDVRIWTPNVGEVPFAGHPTLGAAYIIHSVLENSSADTVKLNLKAGQITVIVTPDGLTMRQSPPQFGEMLRRTEIAEVFGISPEVISDRYPIQWVSTGLPAVLIPLNARGAVSRIKTDRSAFMRYIERHPSCNCSHLFFVDMGKHTFSARCMMEDFLEDPATGSANGSLAAYLLKHNYFSENDIKYTVRQGEDMNRISVLNIHAALASDEDWLIEVGGRCHLVASGEWE